MRQKQKITHITLNEKLGQVVKKYRKAKHHTQISLSSELYIDSSTLSRYETGDKEIPYEVLHLLHIHLGDAFYNEFTSLM